MAVVTDIAVPPQPPIIAFVSELVYCVCELLTTDGQGPTCWCGVINGDAAPMDNCDGCANGACGMGFVRMGPAFPYSTFPVPVLDANCVKPLAYTLEVGVVRCYPTMEEDGTMPSPEAIADAAYGLAMDQMALHRAIRCCQGEATIGQWNTVGPAGNCIMGSWSVFVDPVFRSRR